MIPDATLAEWEQDPHSRVSARRVHELIAEIRRLREEVERLGRKADEEMLRAKACEHIADGEEGWERLRDECPSTAAVAGLRDALAAHQAVVRELARELVENNLPADVLAHPLVVAARTKGRDG